jgi:hypothetical protein
VQATIDRADACKRDTDAYFSRVTVTSVLATLPGFIVYGLVSPGARDVRKVVERHGLSAPQVSLQPGLDGLWAANLRLVF